MMIECTYVFAEFRVGIRPLREIKDAIYQLKINKAAGKIVGRALYHLGR